MKTSLWPLLCLLLCACATRPEAIVATPVPADTFATLPCPALAEKSQQSRAELTEFTVRQNEKADTDALWVMLIGIPPSKFTGNYEADVARLKGEVAALRLAQAERHCERDPANRTGATTSP